MSEWWIMILGMVAGLLTTGSFVPQVVKAWREGDTNALSLRMYLVMTAAFALWLGYGLIIGSWPIIVFNVCNLMLSAVILWLKLREDVGSSSGGLEHFRAHGEHATGLPGRHRTGCRSS